MNATTDILNAEEIEDVMILRNLKGMPADYIRSTLWNVAWDVESFTTSNFRTGHRAADWFLRVAEALSGQNFASSMGHSFTIADVVRVVEKAIEDAMADYLEHWVDDPIDFAKWHPMAKVGENGPTDHPWGDEEVAVLRKWLAVRPYRIWAVQNAVHSAAEYAMKSALLDMATDNESGQDIQRIAKETFDKAVAARVPRAATGRTKEHAVVTVTGGCVGF